jgi:hypothetical protein
MRRRQQIARTRMQRVIAGAGQPFEPPGEERRCRCDANAHTETACDVQEAACFPSQTRRRCGDDRAVVGRDEKALPYSEYSERNHDRQQRRLSSVRHSEQHAQADPHLPRNVHAYLTTRCRLISPLGHAVIAEPMQPKAQGNSSIIVGRGWRQHRSLQHVRLQLAHGQVTTC